MTAFLIASLSLFIISIASNIAYIVNPNTIFKGTASFGLIVFSVMAAWAIFLLVA